MLTQKKYCAWPVYGPETKFLCNFAMGLFRHIGCSSYKFFFNWTQLVGMFVYVLDAFGNWNNFNRMKSSKRYLFPHVSFEN